MKIGIVTLDDNSNYGNRLQNYAVYNILQNYGDSVDVIVVKTKEEVLHKSKKTVKKAIGKIFPPCMFFKILQSEIFLKNKLLGDIKAKRNYIFSKFMIAQISKRIVYLNKYEDIKDSSFKMYDYIFVGSDQVWNPDFAGSDYYFLTFVPPEKRIGFIASIGLSELPDEQKGRYAELLKQMKYISVREESAVEIVKELTGRDADCFLDPVLLLEEKRWEELMQPVPSTLPPKYILSFFLGQEPEEQIKKFAIQRKLSIVHMNQMKYKEYYVLDPAQLLFTIKNAEVILTDSFHVTAFSIIFSKQFYVFKRKETGMENMFSRMETLLRKLSLMERVQEGNEIEDRKDISVEQYRVIGKILTEERTRFERTIKDKMFSIL